MAAGESVDPARWQVLFEELMGRIAGRFARVEPRRRVRQFVAGVDLREREGDHVDVPLPGPAERLVHQLHTLASNQK